MPRPSRRREVLVRLAITATTCARTCNLGPAALRARPAGGALRRCLPRRLLLRGHLSSSQRRAAVYKAALQAAPRGSSCHPLCPPPRLEPRERGVAVHERHVALATPLCPSRLAVLLLAPLLARLAARAVAAVAAAGRVTLQVLELAAHDLRAGGRATQRAATASQRARESSKRASLPRRKRAAAAHHAGPQEGTRCWSPCLGTHTTCPTCARRDSLVPSAPPHARVC